MLELLRTKQLLLVLDNCEHVLNVAGRFAEAVVRACPDVHILATSREGLAVEGEQIRPLRSLSLPEPLPPMEVVATSDCGVLFVDRAPSGAPGFALDASNTPAVAEMLPPARRHPARDRARRRAWSSA